ncbi:DNA recombination protein RmuC [Patescibacteria group bacterium]|nr:DNA recombination protein RmuC [Patescibacteria group bacterium]
MDINTILIILGSIAIGAAFGYLILKGKKSDVSQNIIDQMNSIREEMLRTGSDQRREVQEKLDRVHDKLTEGLQHSQTSIQRQFSESSKIIAEVTQKLTTLDSTNKQVLDFSSQLQNLQNILKNPKQRGVLGEYWLETLLSNVLPTESYQMQYKLGDDEKLGQALIADAVIFIRDQIIPIDAKFSLENYNRVMEETDAERREKLEKALKADVKNRIDETSKYIRPEFGTMNFAFMFIPAEGVYYNLLNAEVGSGINSRSLVEYAFSKNVMIVSPTSFYAYLQTVLQGLNALQIEKSASEIIKRVGELGKHLRSYADYHEKIGGHLSTVVNQYNLSGKELQKVSKDAARITTGSKDDIIEIEEIDKPRIE